MKSRKSSKSKSSESETNTHAGIAHLDAQGRMHFPAPIREALKKMGTEFYVLLDSPVGQRTYPLRKWEEIERQLETGKRGFVLRLNSPKL
jgi:DNA-binding transcriptional regulator/RsmH inhibitor MraZ